jgi:hypothetical protein
MSILDNVWCVSDTSPPNSDEVDEIENQNQLSNVVKKLNDKVAEFNNRKTMGILPNQQTIKKQG